MSQEQVEVPDEIGKKTASEQFKAGSKAECSAVEEVSLKWFPAVATVSRFLYDGQIQRSLCVFGPLTDGRTESQVGTGEGWSS